MMNSHLKRYSELTEFVTFDERFRYLRLDGHLGIETFGFDRVFNQQFYLSNEWKHIRNYIIVRDSGCDLGIADRKLQKNQKIFIHHMNPIDLDDIKKATKILLDPDFLITCSFETHNAIHYGNDGYLENTRFVERKPNDTCPWRK